MNEELILAFAGISCFLASLAAIISVLVLRKAKDLGRETAAIRTAMEFASLESRRQQVSQSIKAWEDSASALRNDARRLAADLSKIFAGVASVLNETHKLEGNPHPKIDSRQLHEINQKLLAIGEGSLSATRIAEELAEEGRKLSEQLTTLKRHMETGSR